MANSVVLKLVCMVFLCMVVAAPYAQAAVSCGQVTNYLSPCFGYLQSGGSVPKRCCKSISSLKKAARSKRDRQSACRCLKDLAGKVPGMKPDRAVSLPKRCGVNVGYPISVSVDCSKVR